MYKRQEQRVLLLPRRELHLGPGARVDGVKVEDVEQEVALAGAEVKLSSGKKKHALLVAK